MNWTDEDILRRNREVLGIVGDPITTKIRIDGDFKMYPTDDLMPEWMFEAEATRILEEDGWRALRTDPVSDRGRGKGFGEIGMADHWFGRPLPAAGPYAVEMLWCEFKSGKKKAEKHQTEWHVNERARGFQTWIANEDFPATLQGFRDHYEKSGLMRRPRWW